MGGPHGLHLYQFILLAGLIPHWPVTGQLKKGQSQRLGLPDQVLVCMEVLVVVVVFGETSMVSSDKG